MRTLGESIYVKGGSGRTIDFHDMLDFLRNNKGIRIPEYPDLEMIHDQRNIIQHKGGTISEQEAQYYINMAFKFIERFWKDELQISLRSVLDRDYYKMLEPLVKLNVAIFEYVKISDSVNIEVKLRNPQWILIAYAELEKELQKLSTRMSLDNNLTPTEVVGELVKNKKLSHFDSLKFRSLKELRERYAHTEISVESNEVEKLLRIASELLGKIKKM